MSAWSPYQQNIFAYVADRMARNALVIAVAGSGKSVTAVESISRIPAGKTHIILAFNKSIATELKNRGVNARTFHSLTFGPVLRFRGTQNVESNKLRMLCDQNMTRDDSFMYSSFACRLVGLVRQMGIGFMCPNEYWVYDEVCDHHDLQLDSEKAVYSTGIEWAMKLLEWSNASTMCDFDDLLYFAVRDNVALPKFDFVFVDEAQDTNAIQREIIKKILAPGGRLIAVGDPSQAIYGFRGADSNSMNLLAQTFGAIELPLTVSYRCGVKIVEYAKQWVNHIEAAPGAPDGVVNEMGTKWDNKVFTQEDLVICRTTAPLVTLAYRLMRDRIPVQIMGKDIGSGLISIIKKQKAESLDALLIAIEVWAARECEAARMKQREDKAQAIQDKANAITTLADTLGEHERSIDSLTNIISSLFSDRNGPGLKLATIHKAKGMESHRVFWLNRNACPAKWAKQPWQKQQEINLCYVAATRAKLELNLIEDGSK